ncbi:MAG: hypothetical protein WKG03_00360 [Telluria sp.]
MARNKKPRKAYVPGHIKHAKAVAQGKAYMDKAELAHYAQQITAMQEPITEQRLDQIFSPIVRVIDDLIETGETMVDQADGHPIFQPDIEFGDDTCYGLAPALHASCNTFALMSNSEASVAGLRRVANCLQLNFPMGGNDLIKARENVMHMRAEAGKRTPHEMVDFMQRAEGGERPMKLAA